jgi:putative protein kinase ArgK-like GTPase of G3E family
VVADIPGLIEGASEGAGLGHLFLRHLQRTRVLLHVVDLAPFDDAVDPVKQAKAIVNELKIYDDALYKKPRWLVLNKLDMIPAEERVQKVVNFVKRYGWKGPVFQISALTREGCEHLVQAIYQHVASMQEHHEEADIRFEAEGDLVEGAVSLKAASKKSAQQTEAFEDLVAVKSEEAEPVKPAAKKAPAKKAAAKKAAATKVAAKKAPAKKAAAEKAVAETAVAKNAPAKKVSPAAKKAAVKAAAKKVVAKKSAVKPVSQPVAKKAAAKSPAAKPVAAKKAVAKKAVAKKAVAKKPAAKKAAPEAEVYTPDPTDPRFR